MVKKLRGEYCLARAWVTHKQNEIASGKASFDEIVKTLDSGRNPFLSWSDSGRFGRSQESKSVSGRERLAQNRNVTRSVLARFEKIRRNAVCVSDSLR